VGRAMIETQDVKKHFGAIRAVDGITIKVYGGEIFGIVGPNGSGKTTLLNLAVGLMRPTTGTIRVDGLDPIADRLRVRRLLGVVPQETALYDDLTARENLSYHHALYADDPATASGDVTAALELMLLAARADDLVRTFSGGMKRRLALARALLHSPKLILFDEPTLGVDVQGTHVLWDKIRDLRDTGKTVVITTNVMSEAEQLCDRIAIIDHGRLIVLDTPDALKDTLGDDVIELELSEPLSVELVRDVCPQDARVATEERTVWVHSPRGEAILGDVVGSLRQHAEILRVELRRPSLDDVFLHYTGRQLRE